MTAPRIMQVITAVLLMNRLNLIRNYYRKKSSVFLEISPQKPEHIDTKSDHRGKKSMRKREKKFAGKQGKTPR